MSNNISKYNHEEKSMKAPFVTHADMESLLVKIDNCQNNPEKTSTVKINSHRPSGFPMFTH